MGEPEHVGPQVVGPSGAGRDGPARLVRVEAIPQLAREVRRHVEATLGWTVLDREEAWARPAVVLTDGAEPAVLPAEVPVVLLVGEDVTGDRAAAAAVACGARAVVSWPAGRGRLDAVVEGLVARATPREADVLVLAGAAGGVGTTTVALAVGGLHAWGGRSTLAVATGDVPAPRAAAVQDDALAALGAWDAAVPVPGAPALRLLARPPAPLADVPTVGVPGNVRVVLDVGVARGFEHVLVARRDRAGRDAVAASAAGAVVLLDDGPLPEREVLQAARGRTVCILPWSARVARAGARQLVPAGLPGSWLAPLEALVDASA